MLLVLSLACTPLNSLFGWREAIKLRRPLGVYAFLYVCMHFTTFVYLDYGLDPGLGQLGAQAVGSLVIIFVMGGVAYLFFKICNAVTKGGIRPAEDVELQGIDREEMGVIAYNDLTLAELVLAGEDPAEDKVLASTTSPDPTTGR